MKNPNESLPRVVAVIPAGGSGTRFWPLSRAKFPKQVLNLSGHDAMINETVKRSLDVIPEKYQFIITAKEQAKTLKDILLPEIPRENIFSEPCKRNTAPCILYSAFKLKKLFGDCVMCVFPSDQYITDQKAFLEVLEKGISLAEKSDHLITLGIGPSFPSSGYGYIHFNSARKVGDAFAVSEFVEKPDTETASRYLQTGVYLWNSGIFLWKISSILTAFQRYLPRMYDTMKPFEEISEAEEKEWIEKVYPTLQDISIDYGIMERSGEVLVIPADMGWSDVGSWDSLGAIVPPERQGNIVRAENNIGIDTRDCIIYSDRQLVTTIGLKDMIVVSTKDALMVCPKEKAQEVKKITQELNRRNLTEYL